MKRPEDPEWGLRVIIAINRAAMTIRTSVNRLPRWAQPVVIIILWTVGITLVLTVYGWWRRKLFPPCGSMLPWGQGCDGWLR